MARPTTNALTSAGLLMERTMRSSSPACPNGKIGRTLHGVSLVFVILELQVPEGLKSA